MVNLNWPNDPVCFIHPLDDHGVSIIRFDQRASHLNYSSWSGGELFWNKDLWSYLAYHSESDEYLKPPNCRPEASELTFSINNTSFDLPRQPNLHILMGTLLIILIILMIIICILTGTVSSLRTKLRLHKQGQSTKDNDDPKTEGVSGVLNKFEQYTQQQQRISEICMQTLILSVSQLSQLEPYNPEWKMQLKQAVDTIAKYRDSCGSATVIPVRLRPSTLPRPVKMRPKSIRIPHDDPNLDIPRAIEGQDDFLLSLPDPNLVASKI